MSATGSNRESGTSITFGSGLESAVVFLIAVATAPLVLFLLAGRFVPPGPVANALVTAAGIAAVAAFAWAVLRTEGVSAGDVGLSTAAIVPGVLPVALVWLGVNGVGYGLLTLQGQSPTMGLPADSVVAWVATAVAMWVFVGPGEEFAFRGYLQNKAIAHAGRWSGNRRITAGILAASAVFSVLHVPQLRLVQGLAVPDIASFLVLWAVYAVVLGTVYELTRNVVLVGTLHGTFNHQPIFLLDDAGDPTIGLTVLVLPLGVVAVLGYRRWAKRARPEDFRPQRADPSAGQ